MPAIWKDFRYAVRGLLRSPAYSAVALFTLALGIGANSAIFSVVNQVLLNPAGVTNPERVVALRVNYQKLALLNIGVSVPDFTDVLHSKEQFESAALIRSGDLNYTGGGAPERLRGAQVSWQWFQVFGAHPQLGRVFDASDDRPDANHQVVLAYAAWKRLFGLDPNIIGRSMELNQVIYRVAGVMGPEFRAPLNVDVWSPLGLADSAYDPGNRFNESFSAMARLRPNVSFDSANALVKVLSQRLRNSDSQLGAYAKDADWGMFLKPYTDFVAGDTKTPILVLLGAVSMVLLIACANIAGLTLARASGRGREVAVRAALGAGRWDLIRGTLSECLVLALAGALGGLAVAYAGTRGLVALAPDGLPFVVMARPGGLVIAFTIAAASVAAILFGVAPAWQISRLNRYELLKEGARSNTAGLGRQHLRSMLVIGEVALALVLLVGAGLLVRSLAALEDVNPGFNANGVITATVSLPPVRYPDDTHRVAFYRGVVEKLAALPGVTSASVGSPLPFSGQAGSASFAIVGRTLPPNDPGPHGAIGLVGPEFFTALQIPVLRGRVFTEQDRAGSEAVAVIDDLLARQYWPNENPIGQRIANGRAKNAVIVGIVGHIRQGDLSGEEVKGKYYFPVYQSSSPMCGLIVRAGGDAARLAAGIRQAVTAIDPSEPLGDVRLLSDMVESSLAPRRFVVTVLGVFAGMALLLAVIGLYGVISYAVTQRTQELGVRVALGAQTSEIMRLVLGQGMRLAGIGALIGLGVSMFLSSLLSRQLYRVSAFDPLTLVLMAAVLVAAALLASYIPARRATRVDPMVALRYE